MALCLCKEYIDSLSKKLLSTEIFPLKLLIAGILMSDLEIIDGPSWVSPKLVPFFILNSDISMQSG
jgi:hypothetical protein